MDIEKIVEQIRAKLPYARLVGIQARIRWGIIAAIPLVIMAIFYFLLTSPSQVEAAKIKDELVKARQEVQKKQGLERRLPEFEKEIAAKDYELALLRRQLPEQREIPELIDQVSNLGTQSGLRFLTFKPQREVEKDFYAEVPVELKIRGKFHNLVSFFDRISRLPRIVTISNLNIVESKKPSDGSTGGGTFIEATCSAITFRFIEARIDAPAEDDKKKGKKGKKR